MREALLDTENMMMNKSRSQLSKGSEFSTDSEWHREFTQQAYSEYIISASCNTQSGAWNADFMTCSLTSGIFYLRVCQSAEPHEEEF